MGDGRSTGRVAARTRTIGRGGGAAALVIGLVASSAAPLHAQEAARTCAGHPVTISWDDPGVGPTINGTNGPDVIQGGPGNETILAGGGEDVVCGGAGTDRIDGGPGRDELLGEGDSDTFVGADLAQDVVTGGGRELDTADYGQSPNAVQVNETTGLVTGGAVNGGILGMEVVKGSNLGDTLVGRVGDDSLRGGAGNDVLEGRGGEDELNGGSGRDTVSFARVEASVRLSLSNDVATVGTGSTTRVTALVGFEDAEGTRFDDLLNGDEGNNELTGGGGDDVIRGKAGDDILGGGGGDDVLHPGPGDDFVDGGANDPVTSSGAHGDLVSYQGDTVDPGAVQFEAYLAPFPQLGLPPGASGVGEDEFSGVESIRGVKTKGNLLQGDDGPNVMIGGPRTDLLEGFGGNDLLFALEANDALDGGPGADFLDAGSPTGPDDADLNDGGDGNDTCLSSVPDLTTRCETVD